MSIFNQIIQREVSAEIVQENEQIISFMDIYPKGIGHTLVVPKRECPNFDELQLAEIHSLIEVVSLVAKAQQRAFGNSDYNLILNNGALASQQVFHVHMHVIPRYKEGQAPSGDIVTLAKQLRQAIIAAE